MQEDYEIIVNCVTVYEIDFFLNTLPECKKTMKL
jgi:hypothetical protein